MGEDISSSLESSISAFSTSSVRRIRFHQRHLSLILQQSDSMVEIKRTDSVLGSSGAQPLEEDRYRLVYSKSKVYVNPTAYARDNIPGFVALVKRVRATQPSSINECSIVAGGRQPDISSRLDSGDAVA